MTAKHTRPILLLSLLWLWLMPPMLHANSIDSLKTLLASAKSDTAKHTLLRELGKAYADSNYTRALDYHKQSLAAVEHTPYKNKIAEAYFAIGRLYYLQGDFNMANTNLTNALRIFEHLDMEENQARTTNMLGLTYERKGKYDVATHYFLRALQIYERSNNIDGISQVTNNLGQLQYYRENYDKAIEHFQHFYNVSKELKNVSNMAGATNNIASAYMEMMEYNKAIEYYLIALNIYDSIGFSLGKGVILDNLGLLYTKIARYNDALEHHRKALAIFEAANSQYRLGIVKKNIANIYIKQDDIKTGIEELNQALDIMRPLGITDEQRSINLSLSLAYEKLHDYKTAYNYLKNYKEIDDSISNVTTLQNIERIKEEYEAEKRNRIEEDTNRELRLNRLLIICMGVSLTVVIALLTLIYAHNKRQRTKLQRLTQVSQSLIAATEPMLNVSIDQLTQSPSPFRSIWLIAPKASTSLPTLHFRCQAIPSQPDTIAAYIVHQRSQMAPVGLIGMAVHQFLATLSATDTLEALDQRITTFMRQTPLTQALTEAHFDIHLVAIRPTSVICYTNNLLSIYANNSLSSPTPNQWYNLSQGLLYIHASPNTIEGELQYDFLKMFNTLAQYEFDGQQQIALNSLNIIDMDKTSLICALQMGINPEIDINHKTNS